MVSAPDVIKVISTLEAAGVSYWLDGGWGVDALLGKQTRPHDDLDLVARLDEAPAITEALSPLGFAMSLDDRPTRFVLSSGEGRRIDFHPLVFDADRSACQIGAGPNGGDAVYPANGFAGRGTIDGHAVPCLTPQLILRHHLGYPPQPKDWHNVRHLCHRFGLPLPDTYKPFTNPRSEPHEP